MELRLDDLRLIIDAFPFYVMLVDESRNIIYANKAIEQYTAAHFSEFDLKSGNNYYFWCRKSRFFGGFPSSIA